MKQSPCALFLTVLFSLSLSLSLSLQFSKKNFRQLWFKILYFHPLSSNSQIAMYDLRDAAARGTNEGNAASTKKLWWLGWVFEVSPQWGRSSMNKENLEVGVSFLFYPFWKPTVYLVWFLSFFVLMFVYPCFEYICDCCWLHFWVVGKFF